MLYYIAIIWLLQDLDAKTFHKAFVNLDYILADGTFLEANDFFGITLRAIGPPMSC